MTTLENYKSALEVLVRNGYDIEFHEYEEPNYFRIRARKNGIYCFLEEISYTGRETWQHMHFEPVESCSEMHSLTIFADSLIDKRKLKIENLDYLLTHIERTATIWNI